MSGEGGWFSETERYALAMQQLQPAALFSVCLVQAQRLPLTLAPRYSIPPFFVKHIHFIAIGGAVMHQLALALSRTGNTVTGSDDDIADPAKSNLAAAGLLPAELGWHPDRITPTLDAVVLGMHAKGDNPELQRAQELDIPIYSFPEYVYEVSREKQRVVVAGSHGKTTITSMIMHVLKNHREFDYLVGARVPGFADSVQLSEAPLILLEGDEYPASAVERRPKIHFYKPHVSVLSGIAWDHVNVFPTYENYFEQFAIYLRGMEGGATLIYNREDPEVVKLVQAEGAHLKTIPYGMPAYHYEDGTAVLDTDTGPVPLQLFGSHNLLNSEAARMVCDSLGVTNEEFYRGIQDFTGAARRLEKLFSRDSIVAYRDFAHAPSKLKATLDAVREAYPSHTLVALFELHTYSSLSEGFLAQYAGSMASADVPVVYFSSHALHIKGLLPMDAKSIKVNFDRADLQVYSEAEALANAVKAAVGGASGPVCLLLMSSGTFDNVDWSEVA